MTTALRHRLVFGCVVLMSAVMIGTAILWFSNTESLAFPHQDEPLRLAPGETIELEVDGCLPNSAIRYRPTVFGRWQETHVNGKRDIRRWWVLSRREYTEVLVCRDGPWVVHVPDDLVSNHFAVCGLSNSNCVEVVVERAD